MRSEREERLSAELLNLIGPTAFLRLAESFGGRRLFVPVSADGTQLTTALGRETTERLIGRYGRSYLRVPLARAHRARHYRDAGLSNGEIAHRLGMTETGVDKIFARMAEKPQKGARQLTLFS